MVSFFNQIPNDTKKVQSINVLYSNVDNVRQMCPVQVSDATISHGFGSNGKRETLEQAITRAPQIGSTEGGRVKKFPQRLPRRHKGRCGRGLAVSCGEPEPLPPASPLAAGFPEPGRHRRPDHPKVSHCGRKRPFPFGCIIKMVGVFSSKFQRDNQQNASAADFDKGKAG